MIAETPTGEIGIICDKCSYIIEHEIVLSAYLKTKSTTDFCAACKAAKGQE